ncbi:hypothetical protein EHQ94_00355 [Leptospira meyeri]|nr:hypothetical protein EHQ93_10750 [Leptospira meyeri]TGM73978.1 hypothetical protein EHQ94_00355 [Leptospira meyeri]
MVAFVCLRKGSQRKSFRETKDWSEEPGRFLFCGLARVGFDAPNWWEVFWFWMRKILVLFLQFC